MNYAEMLASTASARAQMEFQERMSNTAVQRQVADMKAAGINPVLSAKFGGASTPEGASGDYSAVLNLLADSMSTNAQAVHALGSSASQMQQTIKSALEAVSSSAKEVKAQADYERDREAKLEDQTTTATQFKILGIPFGEWFNAIARASGYRNWSDAVEDSLVYQRGQNKDVGNRLFKGLQKIVNIGNPLNKTSGKKVHVSAGLSSKF